MTEPQPSANPPAKPDTARKGRQPILIAGAVVAAILIGLGGLEALSQLSRHAPAPTVALSPVAEIPVEPAVKAPVPKDEPVVPAPVEAPPMTAAPEPPVVVAEAETPPMDTALEPAPPAAEPEIPVPAVTMAEAPATLAMPEAPAPTPEQVAESPAALENTAEAPMVPAEVAAEPAAPDEPAQAPEAAPEPTAVTVATPAETVAVDLAVTKTKGESPSHLTGDIVWLASQYPSLSAQYAGTISFASGGSAIIVFNRSLVTTALTLDVVATDGPLLGVAAIAVLRADGKDISIEISVEHATLAGTGASDGSFETLLNATQLKLALLFENGDTGILTLAKPPLDGLEAVLFPGRTASDAKAKP